MANVPRVEITDSGLISWTLVLCVCVCVCVCNISCM
jgi:hypothetical protein